MEELLRAVAYGKISVHQVTEVLPVPRPEAGGPAHAWDRDLGKLIERAEKRSETGVRVRGVPNIMVRFARCCNPVLGEAIVGFITRGRGVTVHAKTCPKAQEQEGPERWIEAKWDEAADILQRAKIRVVSVDQPGLLAGISKSIAAADVNISNAKVWTTGDNQGVAHFEVMVRGLDHLKEVMHAIEKVRGVLSVERLQH
jgi:GTP pyrophosphokinase